MKKKRKYLQMEWREEKKNCLIQNAMPLNACIHRFMLYESLLRREEGKYNNEKKNKIKAHIAFIDCPRIHRVNLFSIHQTAI